MQRYLEDYVRHFGLTERLRLGAAVTRVRRVEDDGRWEIWVEGKAEPLRFDKVVIASGPQTSPFIPNLAGSELFEGESIHSRAYKR